MTRMRAVCAWRPVAAILSEEKKSDIGYPRQPCLPSAVRRIRIDLL